MNHSTRYSDRRRGLGLIVAVTVLVSSAAGYTIGAVGSVASAQSPTQTGRAAPEAARHAAAGAPLSPFQATGLPDGPSTGVPQHLVFPAGFTLTHTHGGPTYVYVLSGTLIISDKAGTKTYPAGSFFWESPGHVHTVHTTRPAQAFVLTFLPPGADATIPVK